MDSDQRERDKQVLDWLYGRMMEACDIAHAIESGQFKTLAEVLQACEQSAEACSAQMKAAGVKFARSLSQEEFAAIENTCEGIVKH
jgi:F0F1-type ATP synthase delta subunit